VTSFRATLEEVEQAEVLLHVRDAASSYGDEQKSQVEKVLGELNALSKPRVEVLNKIDLLESRECEGIASRGRSASAREVLVSARTGEGIHALLGAIDEVLYSDPLIEAELDIPQKEGAALAAIEAGMVIRNRSYEGNLVHLSVAGPASLMGRFREFKSR
jgi:GTP-binding protein HflX